MNHCVLWHAIRTRHIPYSLLEELELCQDGEWSVENDFKDFVKGNVQAIGLHSWRYIVIQVYHWWVTNTLVFLISRKFWIRLHKCTSRHLYSFNTSIYARTTRMQEPWMRPKLNIMLFIHGGCHLELPQNITKNKIKLKNLGPFE